MMVPAASRVARPLCLLAAAVALLPLPATAQLSPKEQRCVTRLNEGLIRVARAQGKENLRCLRAAARGRLSGTVEDCLGADAREVRTVTARAVAAARRRCAGLSPGYGATDAGTVAEAATGAERSLVLDLFAGRDGAAILTEAAAKNASKCQQQVARQMQRCSLARYAAFLGCKRKGLRDGSIADAAGLAACMDAGAGRVAGACATGVRNRIRDRCEGVDPATTFQGCGAATPEALAGCVERAVACRVCLAVDRADGLARDCEVFDDDRRDRSCADPIGALPVDEAVSVAGLGAETDVVDVVIDDHGVVHVYGADLTSVLFVQGYMTARQRFFAMDVLRRFARGRLSELFGAFTIALDVENRTLFTARDGRRIEAALWERAQAEFPEGAAQAEAYAAGINAWLDDLRAGRNGATLPPEYAFFVIGQGPEDLAPWHPEDTLALGRLQQFTLSDSSADELARARIVAALPPEIVRDVFRLAPATAATVLPLAPAALVAAAPRKTTRIPSPPVPRATLDAVLGTLAERARANPLGSGSAVGSNNWIVAPSLSASGHAMLANDPHLQLFNPPIWHMVQLVVEGDGPGSATHNDVNGVNFSGLPGVILGHNAYGAWGATVSAWDVTDIYVEQVTTPADYPASPRTVLFAGQQVPVLRLEEEFRINGQAPRTYVIEVVPHHGPMLPDPDLEDDVVGLAATGMSVRWTGHEVSLDSRFLSELNRARNVEEFRAALRYFAAGGQNYVWADVHGDIAYFPYVLVPQRPAGAVPYLPLPGTGEAEWLTDAEGHPLWVPEERLPQATNPAEGFLATANNDQNGNTFDNDPLDDAVYLGSSYDIGFRAERIRELLTNAAGLRAAGAPIGLADMARYQYDHQSKEAARLLPFLFAAAAARPDLVTAPMAEALERLRAWGEAKPGTAPGAVAYDMVSGVDAATTREDVTPRPTPVSAEERADAVASSLFVAWTTRLPRRVLADELEAAGIGAPGGDDATKALLHLLEDVARSDDAFRVHTLGGDGESTLWDDVTTPAAERRDDMLLGALADGLEFLAGEFQSADQSTWLWGAIHPARFQHFIGQGGLPIFDLFPFPAPGGRFTVNPAGFSLNADQFDFASGPSMRLVVILDPGGIRAVNVLPGGNNGNPGGKDNENFNRINPDLDYGTHIPAWLNGETLELHIDRDDVAAHTTRRIRFSPGAS